MNSPLAGSQSTTNMKLNYPYQIKEWVRTLPTRDDWLLGEPHIHEMLTDPIVRRVTRRDNLGPADVWRAIERGRAALHGRAMDTRNVA